MAVRYSGHMVRTRRQAAWLDVALLLALLPAVAWRLSTQPIGVAIAMAMLTAAPFVTAYQSWRFLERQERVHQEPTPEMHFIFRFLANTPLTLGALLLVILVGIT
jgi:hypothetical protein